MAWVAVAIGVGAIGGLIAADMQGDAARDAANTQAGAADRANDIQLQMFEQQRRDAQPWREAGERALGQMNHYDFQRDFDSNAFEADPGYQFRLQEGQRAIERAASARGSMGSGSTLRALTSYGQNIASEEYQNAYNRFNADRDRRFNRLASLAGVGQTANSQLAQAGQNYAGQVGQNMMGAANAQAAGQMAQAGAAGNAITGAANSWMQYQMMNRFLSK